MRIYELNTRAHCTNFNEITADDLSSLRRLGFDAIWLMGVWEISDGSRKVSRIFSEDFQGSPYAIHSYRFSEALGGETAFKAMRERANTAGLSVIVDFVSNHMAVDSPWIEERPDFFIRSNPRARRQSTSDYFLHPSGEVIAFGRDPYFPPWNDTAQLDYTNRELRLRMVEVLKWMSQVADGVRCDLAMLVLRDYIRRQWYPNTSDEWFDEAMPAEFWDHAIREVKVVRPDFTFIAEAYWDKEQQLLDLGFDLAYEKRLYDGLVARDAALVEQRLRRPLDAIKRSLFFIENHDEQRAAAVFAPEENLAAAALILSLPGSVLIYEGQIEGKRERLPVQRLRPQISEPVDSALKACYELLLELTTGELYTSGTFEVMPLDLPGTVGFVREYQGRFVAYIGRIGAVAEQLGSMTVDLTALASGAGALEKVRVRNLVSGQTWLIEKTGRSFSATLSALGVVDESAFCLIEVSAP